MNRHQKIWRAAPQARQAMGAFMLRIYRHQDNRLVPSQVDLATQDRQPEATGAVWVDLINPTRQEDQFAEQLVGVSIPTREEAEEIEVSARLYHEDGAEFMTMTGVSQLETDEPRTTPITFVLKNETLVTIRYAEPKPFYTYTTRMQKAGTAPCAGGEEVMLGLAEALIERMAEALEKVGRGLEQLSREVFRHKGKAGQTTRSRDFQKVIEQLGA